VDDKFWIPRLAGGDEPRYVAIVEALRSDIDAGRVAGGSRLLPHREMAGRLGLSVGTVSRAYALAKQQGLISGEVGRGSFVLPVSPGGSEAKARCNLALNIAPNTGEARLIAETMREVATVGTVSPLLGYLPHQGTLAHRRVFAGWIEKSGVPCPIERLFLTHGAQHAAAMALGAAASAGDTVLGEAYTYSGLTALAQVAGMRLRGVEIDADGIVPEALDAAIVETGARVVYLTPTLQSPTGTILPTGRRAEVADIIRRRDVVLIEDDVYSFLVADPPLPISTLAPERCFYVTGFAKSLAPGIRVGAVAVPEAYHERSLRALRALGWMAAPLMVETVSRIIAGGGLAEQVRRKRGRARELQQIARRTFGDATPSRRDGFHYWLPLDGEPALINLVTRAAGDGIDLAPPYALPAPRAPATGVRLCLGGAGSDEALAGALATLRRIVSETAFLSVV
jgi:DNA-binding transcriptional MocR family regulator